MTRSSNYWLLISGVIGCLTLQPAEADTVELSGGAHVTGKVARLADQKTVIVQVDDDIRIALPESRVRRVVNSVQLAEYEKLAAAAGNDAQRHYQLGIWCVRNRDFPGDSEPYKRYHMRRAIEFDPDHSEARASLGYKKEKGQWVLVSDLMRRRGLILTAGGWELPEVVAMKKQHEAADLKAKKWNKEVARLTTAFRRARNNRKEVWAQLEAIDDPTAAEAVAKQLADTNQPLDLRLLWVKHLGKFRNGVAVQALVKTGIEERDDRVRESALEQLREYGSGSAVAT
ncbi:MAG: hypothetical protein MI861_26950, partial [Pirellulales bacterium]|nr:hypothetical protein [Pirellulales bacterium]